MANKTSSSQFRWSSRSTLGDWADSGMLAWQHAKQRHAGQSVPSDQPVYHKGLSSDRASNNKIAALAAYTKVVMNVFLEWRTACNVLSQRMTNRVDDAELRRQLDQLDSVLGLAETVQVPDRAAAIQRLFLAMLRSGKGYYQSLFNDADEDVIRQYARDYLEEGTIFLTEFDRLLQLCGSNLQGPA